VTSEKNYQRRSFLAGDGIKNELNYSLPIFATFDYSFNLQVPNLRMGTTRSSQIVADAVTTPRASAVFFIADENGAWSVRSRLHAAENVSGCRVTVNDISVACYLTPALVL